MPETSLYDIITRNSNQNLIYSIEKTLLNDSWNLKIKPNLFETKQHPISCAKFFIASLPGVSAQHWGCQETIQVAALDLLYILAPDEVLPENVSLCHSTEDINDLIQKKTIDVLLLFGLDAYYDYALGTMPFDLFRGSLLVVSFRLFPCFQKIQQESKNNVIEVYCKQKLLPC